MKVSSLIKRSVGSTYLIPVLMLLATVSYCCFVLDFVHRLLKVFKSPKNYVLNYGSFSACKEGSDLFCWGTIDRSIVELWTRGARFSGMYTNYENFSSAGDKLHC